jgi:hypothetical protein
MDGFVAIIAGLAILAGLFSFLIAYGEALRRFPRRRARREGARAALVAFVFFAVLGALLVALLFR